jgi:hypothetical protein
MDETREAKFAWAKYYKIQKQDETYLDNLFFTARMIKQANNKMYKIFAETIWEFAKVKEIKMSGDRFYIGMTITSYNEETGKWTHRHPETNQVMYETKKNNPHPVTESRVVNRKDYELEIDMEDTIKRFYVRMDKYEKIDNYYKPK